LKIETFDRDDHQKLVTAEADMEMLDQFKHQAARKISAEAKIAGFRPGKAPYEVVRRTYGDKAIHDEAISLMLDQIYPQVLKETGIDPYGPGQLQEMTQADPPKFSFIVPLIPEVTLGDYRAIRADYNQPVVDDEKVDEVIRRLQRRTAIATPVEKPAVEGSMVDVQVTGRLKNEGEGEDNILVPETSRQMIAGDPRDFTDANGNEWPFPGFAVKLVGLSAGDERTFDYAFPDDGSADDLTGKEAVFLVKVERVHELELHALDDEFAQSLGSYETYDKLREGIKQDLQTEATNNYNRDYVEDLIDRIVTDAEVKYPPAALEHETEHVIARYENTLKRDQLDLETYLKTRSLTREEFIEKEVKPVAEKNLKRNLVLEEFSVQEKIQISNEEAQMILNMAQNQAMQDPAMKSLAKSGVSKKQIAEDLARSTINEIFNQRMMNRLRDIATGKADAVAEETPVEIQAEDAAGAETTADQTPTNTEPMVSAEVPAEGTPQNVDDPQEQSESQNEENPQAAAE
jgi:trigger factor